MRRLKNTSLYDKGHLYLIGFILTILVLYKIYYIFLLAIYIFLFYKKIKITYFLVIFILYIGLFTINSTTNLSINELGIITRYESNKNDKKIFIVRTLFKSYQLKNSYEYDLGDVIKVSGKVSQFNQKTVPGGINYCLYMKSKGIHGIINNEKTDSLINIPVFKIRGINLAIFSLVKDENMLLPNEYSSIFKISYLNILILIFIVKKILYYLNVKKKNKYYLYVLIMCYFIGKNLIFLWFLLDYIFLLLVDRFDNKVSKLDLLSYKIIIIILFNINIIYNYSFIIIALINIFWLIKNDNKIESTLMTFLIILPIVNNFKGHINLTLIIVMPILIYIVRRSYLITILLGIILNVDFILKTIVVFIEKVFLLTDILSIKISFIYLDNDLLIIYYFIIFAIPIIINKKTSIFLLSSVILLLNLATQIKPLEHVMFLDCGQGDSAVIIKNNKVIVVDAFKGVSSYLKYLNIKKIDYLILSHSDLDHTEEAESLILNFTIETLVLSEYDNYKVKHKNTLYINAYKPYKIDEIDLVFLGPLRRYETANNNSIVFNIIVNKISYLFTGDIEIEAENDLINRYKEKLKSDVIKVPHHGSKTSSKDDLLNYVNPKIAVISCGENNKFKFPHKVVIEKYYDRGIIVYETKEVGSIKFTKNKIEIFPPHILNIGGFKV